MVKKVELTPRKKTILKAIVNTHISNGEPVGSKSLTTNQQIALSSATIRNEMAELEEMGYLEQPHTSAGRIPSEMGYRFYVDNLLQQYKLTAGEIVKLNSMLKAKAAELDRLLDNASRVMTALTGYTSLSVKPQNISPSVIKFSVIRVDGITLLLVMILEAGTVKTSYMSTPSEVDDEAALKLQNVLNHHIAGQPMEQVTLPVMMAAEREMGEHAFLIQSAIKCIYDTISEPEHADLRLEGIDRLLQYREYSDVMRLRGLLGALEKKDEIVSMISGADTDKVNVLIGSENAVDPMKDSTLVFKTITQDGHIVGAIGVIGPCRMDYSKVITTVDYLSRSINGLIGGALPPPGENENDPNNGGSS
ncbi:MAG: heat-inducible transcription repressor HrcA [Clostridia bacterium]|nr:heat-inducible transcription repressor HrcA [Clostridia bacterium]